MGFETLEKALKDRGITLNETMRMQLDEYAGYLKEYNEKINLTAITEYEEVLDKHFYDSLLAAKGPLKGHFGRCRHGSGFSRRGAQDRLSRPSCRIDRTVT